MNKKLFSVLLMLLLSSAMLTSCGAPKCEYEGCANDALEGYSFCSDHKCRTSNCESVILDGYHYCEEHKCTVDDCDKEKKTGSDYCLNHTCHYDNCTKLVMEESEYCSEEHEKKAAEEKAAEEARKKAAEEEAAKQLEEEQKLIDGAGYSRNISYEERVKIIAEICKKEEDAGDDWTQEITDNAWYSAMSKYNVTKDDLFLMFEDADAVNEAYSRIGYSY